MSKLIFGTGPNIVVHTFARQATHVGRGPENHIIIQEASVSIRHCIIYVNGPEVIIRDLGSANGTEVNGKLIRKGQMQLESEQIVRFGAVKARLELDESDRDWTSLTDFPSEVQMRILAERDEPGAPNSDAGSVRTVVKG